MIAFFDIALAAIADAVQSGADSIALNVVEEPGTTELFLSDNRTKLDSQVCTVLERSVLDGGGTWEYQANPDFGGSLHFTLPQPVKADEVPEVFWKIAESAIKNGGCTVMIGRTKNGERYSVLLDDLAGEDREGFESKIEELEHTL